ncbi:Mitochondrial transcription termination factor family protein [Salvia divinorum]|uniref:Mitochondrial transcription termination factor family protein n=1 Tax=Salvia divinorum TaxID=28513 RepID=A0ABD1GBL3_SALDI
MQETLHLSSSTTPLPLHNPSLPSTPCPKHLQFPSQPSTISLPSPVKSLANHTPLSVSPAASETCQIHHHPLIGLPRRRLLLLPPLPPTTNLHSAFPNPIHRLLSLGLTVHDLRRIFPMCSSSARFTWVPPTSATPSTAVLAS